MVRADRYANALLTTMPNITLTGELNVLLVLGLALLIGVVALSLNTVLRALHATDRELDISVKPLHFGTKARTSPNRALERMYAAALQRLTDLEQALVSIAEAEPAQVEPRSQAWLDYVCEGLAKVLSSGIHADFRVAIWTDDETDREYLKGLAYSGFDRYDARYEKLPRGTTVAGWVIQNRQELYVPDTAADGLYRPRTRPPRYGSMYAAPLGSEDDPWAVITVDAPSKDGLSEERRAIIRRFGSLASVGARIARSRLSPESTNAPSS